MSDLALFKNTNLALLQDVKDDLTETLSGSNGIMNRRISIKGGVFREVINGKEVRSIEDRALNVVIVKAAPIHSIFFAGQYVEGQVAKPTCWSSNTQTPDANVPANQRQAERCMDCPQNTKGSGQGESRACKRKQRIAVLLDGAIESKAVYQIELPGQSVFGDGENGKMPLQAYGRYLKAHNTPAIAVVTEMRLDTSSATPKLVFKAVRPLEEAELKAAIESQNSEEAIRAVTLTVSQTDGVIPVTKQEEKKVAELAAPKKTEAVEKVEAEPVEEPKKISKKPSAEVKEKSSLDDIVGEWDD
jgi:hypothetical protein